MAQISQKQTEGTENCKCDICRERKPVEIAVVDKAAIREELKKSRERHTVRVGSRLP